MTGPVNVFWEGSQFAHYSLALANRAYCSALIASGRVELTTVPYEPDQFAPGNDPTLQALAAHDLRAHPAALLNVQKRPTVWVRHQWPPRDQRPPRGAKWVIMQPWEYSVMPTVYADVLRQADEVWTASNFSRQALIRSGIETNRVFVIPNGVDTTLFSPTGQRFPLQTSKTFRFLTVGATIYRKGIDRLLDAFGAAFSAQDDVCLVIKDAGSPRIYQGQTGETLIRAAQSRVSAPEMIYLPDYLESDRLAQLYRACDVFVSPYRGEGFSLPTLEALASGLPVIVTAGGSTDDFVDEGCGWLIHATPRSVGHSIYGQALSSEGFLLEPDREHLISLLRTAYEQRGQVAKKGAQARIQAQAWTWTQALRPMLRRIDALTNPTP